MPSNSEYDYEVTQGFYHAYFNTDLQIEYPVVFEAKDGANLKMKLLAVAYLDIASKDYYTFQEIQPNTPIVSGNQILFPNVFDNIDPELTDKNSFYTYFFRYIFIGSFLSFFIPKSFNRD